MKRPDNIRLPNLSLPKKLVSTLLILASLFFFLSTWVEALKVLSPSSNGEGSSILGIALASLYTSDKVEYRHLLMMHAVSLLLLLLTTHFLFRETSFNRRFRFVIVGSAVVCAALDIASWCLAPNCGSGNSYVGLLGILTAIPLTLLTVTPIFQMWIFRRWRSTTGKPQRVVIVGGGFAGLYAATGLNSRLGYSHDLEITLLDRRNYFLFPPLLPSAAAGTIETRQVSFPFRRIFETTNIAFRKVNVSRIDPVAQSVCGAVEISDDPITGQRIEHDATFPYDYLVFAPGSLSQTFRTKGAEEYAFFMRELNDAVVLRNHVIDCFERAAVIDDREAQKEMLRFVIVGAGPTGIETATELFDLVQAVLLKRYPEIERDVPEVCIVQSGNQVLPGWDESIVETTDKQLRKMGIQLVLGGRVSEVGPNFVVVGESKILSRTIVWAAGVRPSSLAEKTGLPLHASGRVEVDEDCRAKGFPNVFVLGDVAHFVDPRTGKELPPLGQVAFQQGSHTARNLVRLLRGKKTKPFRYFNFGGLVSVGEHFAAVNLLGIKISGVIGWFIWRTLYLSKLVGFGNKVRVVLDWTLDLVLERSISQIRDDTAPDHRA